MSGFLEKWGMDIIPGKGLRSTGGKSGKPQAGSLSHVLLPQLWTNHALLVMPSHLEESQFPQLLNGALLNSQGYYEDQIIGPCTGFTNYRALRNN